MAESSENGECEPGKEKTVEEADGSILVLQSQEFELLSQEKSHRVEAVSETVSVMSRHTKRKTEGKDKQSQKKHLMINQPITFKLDINVDDAKNPTSVMIKLEDPLDQQEVLSRKCTHAPCSFDEDCECGPVWKTPKYQWSTKVIPDSYLTVTRSSISSARRVRFNNYPRIATAPTWQVQADPTDEFLLSFSTTAENITWYLTPEEHGTEKQVVAVTDQQYTMNVYHVTNYDDETLPFSYIVP